MQTQAHDTLLRELESLLPVLGEKERAGLIPLSTVKANQILRYAKHRPLMEKQVNDLTKLLNRAKRKHRTGSVTITAATVVLTRPAKPP
jgi:hypothetical protein